MQVVCSTNRLIVLHLLQTDIKGESNIKTSGMQLSVNSVHFTFRLVHYIILYTSETDVYLRIKFAVFWVVTSCSVVVGHQRFRGPYCLHLQGCDVVCCDTIQTFRRTMLPPSSLIHKFCFLPHHYMLQNPENQ
jgi:hypothetical protein